MIASARFIEMVLYIAGDLCTYVSSLTQTPKAIAGQR